jgi:hypothetical protein
MGIYLPMSLQAWLYAKNWEKITEPKSSRTQVLALFFFPSFGIERRVQHMGQ